MEGKAHMAIGGALGLAVARSWSLFLLGSQSNCEAV